MISFDLIDSVLEIGDSDSSNELFYVRFDDFYERQFGPTRSKFNSARLIYMFYGAILSLPLTPKITEHGIDGLLVAKKAEDLKLIVSYATPDKSLSLKLIRFDASVHSTDVSIEQSLIVDAQKLLSSVKERPIDSNELKLALNVIHNVIFQPVTLKPKIVKIANHIEHSSIVSHIKSSELKLVPRSQYAESASLFVKQLQSDVYDVVKYNSHSFTRLLIMHHQMLAQSMQLSTDVNDMYLFMIGALEMNWARLHHLSVHAIFEPYKRAIRSLVINHNLPKKIWKTEPVSIIIQLLKSSLPMLNGNYVDNMYQDMVKNVPNIESKAIVIGIEYKKLTDASIRMDMTTFEKLPFTFLLELDPMENLVDLLLKPFDQATLFRLDYCIEKLNKVGKFGFHAYLYGQLMSYSKYDLEKYVYQGSTVDGRGLTNFAFKIRGTETGVLVDIFQASSYAQRSTYDRIVPVRKLNAKRLLRLTVHQAYNKVNADQLAQVRMVRSDVQFLNQEADLLRQEMIPDADWWPIFNVDPNVVLADMEAHTETFEQLTDSDRLHVMLDSINMRRLQNSMSFLDIIPFMSGIFSDWNKIYYHGFLGILKNDGTPLFLSPLYTISGNEENHARQTLKEISSKYVKFDYFPNPLRRIANFVCITQTSENGNRFGLARLSTFEEHKATFESCLQRRNIVRMKRKFLTTIPCLTDEFSGHTNEALENDEKLALVPESDKLERANPIRSMQMKMQGHLETVNKVSKIIMTAQIFKDMVGALIRGDYKTFAVNTAFLASGPLLECLSMKMIAKGMSLGGSFLGRSLLISAPFLGRLPIMGFVGYDLYEQVKAYKSGNKEAMVNIVGDSAILTIDFATASVEGAEALGLISGVADTMGPIGFAIGTAIFVGVDIYSSVKAVSNIDAMVHLTSWQKFTTGFFSFLHVSPTKTVQKEMFEKSVADTSIDNAANFFKNHPSVKYYIFPSYQENGEFVENNIINLRMNVTRMAHSWPKDVANTRLICAGNSELTVSKTSRLLLNCSNSFGYESTSKDETAVILIGNGNDTVKTFADKPTTFLIGNGHKTIIGSSEDDLFILDGNDTLGYIDGKSGKNVLNLVNFAFTSPVRVNFLNHRLTYSGGKIRTYNIHSVIGRPLVQDTIICDRSTHYVDTQGGWATSPDIVVLQRNYSYDTTIRINGTIHVRNEAIEGNFRYIVSKSFQAVVSQNIAVNTASRFIFEYNLEDLNELEIVNLDNALLYYNITFETNDGSILKVGNIHHDTIYLFKDYSELRISNGTVSINVVSNDTVVKIHEKYVLLSKKLNGVINVFSMLKNISMLFGSGKAIHHRNSNDSDNHINILPNDPNHVTYLVGGESQNVFRISAPHFRNTNACSLTIMPSVTIMNYADNDFVNVIDLYEIILLIHEHFSGHITVRMETRGSDILMRVNAECLDGAITNFINITVDKALENENYKHVVVNMRRPMTIMLTENSTFLVPADYKLPNETYSVFHSGLVEPYTTVVSPRLLGKYDVTVHNRTNLILTNLKHVDDVNDMVVIIFKDFLFFDKLQTLRLKFPDQVFELYDRVKDVSNGFRNFEDIFDDEKRNVIISS